MMKNDPCLSGTFGQGISSTVHIGWVLLMRMQWNSKWTNRISSDIRIISRSYQDPIRIISGWFLFNSKNQEKRIAKVLGDSLRPCVCFIPGQIGHVAFSWWCPSPVLWSKLSRSHSTLWELVKHRRAFEKSPAPSLHTEWISRDNCTTFLS